MANGGEFTEVWESDCGPGSSGKLACAHCDIYYSWGNGQSWPREANLNILTDCSHKATTAADGVAGFRPSVQP